MQTKPLGGTGLQFTTIGLGTWAMGGGGWAFAWGPQDDAESTRAIYRALDLGVNWIDTAPAYGLGHCEEVVGAALKGMASRPFIATKCGRSWDAERKLSPNLKKETVRAEIDASLKRLRTDVIDLYQIHWPQPDADIEEAWGVIAAAVQAGKIRFAGVCNFNVAQIKRLQPIHPVASAQPPYSLLVRDAEAELLPHCAAHNMGVVAYSPMQKGLLTGKFSAARIAKLRANLELVEGLRRIAQARGKTVGQLAVAWVLRRPEVTAAIVGARQPAQIEETAGGAGWTLSPEELVAVEELLRQQPAHAQ